MARRFRIYDTGPNTSADRYTIVDSRPWRPHGVRFYLGMSAEPFHPQGVGMHGEFSPEVWGGLVRARFRNLGKRIEMADLPPNARKAAERFVRDHSTENDR